MNIGKLMARMTVEDKVAQLCAIVRYKPPRNLFKEYTRQIREGWGSFAGTVRHLPARAAVDTWNRIQAMVIRKSHAKIPAILHDECLHGLLSYGATIYPQAIGIACTWDPSLMERVASAIGLEARSRGVTQALSPTINLARDPRCGRTEETYGEDALLTGRFAVSFIRSIQARGLAATPKHFAANFVGDGGRDSHDIHFSELELRESYFPAFEAAIREAGAMSLMPAYNTLNGIPCASNSWLLNDVLRKEWGFGGFTGSDYAAVINQWEKQHYAADRADAARKALLGGMDVEWPDGACYPLLAGEVRAGRVPRAALDASVRRVLGVKERVGLFSNPYANPDRAAALSDAPEHRALSLETARRTLVLLKNRGILPLPRGMKKLAVIGPNAAKGRTGGYSGWGVHVVSPLAGLQARLAGRTEVVYEHGCTLTGESRAGFRKAVEAARRADAAVLFMGGTAGGGWEKADMTEGEQRDRCDLRLMGVQEDLIRGVAAANRRTVVVIVNGSAVVMSAWIDRVAAVLNAWYPGEEGGTAIAEALMGDFSPSGKLVITFPKATGVLPYYYNIKPTGRVYDYTDLRGPLHEFPFGHGLSYTRFDYRGFRAWGEKGGIRVTGEVRNAGKVRCGEIVQLYVHDQLASMTRPLKELKGWARLELGPGETGKVDMTVGRKDLTFLDRNLRRIFEPGAFEVMVGASSEDIRFRAEVGLK